MSPTEIVLSIAMLGQKPSSKDPLIAVRAGHSQMLCLHIFSSILHSLEMGLLVSVVLCCADASLVYSVP